MLLMLGGMLSACDTGAVMLTHVNFDVDRVGYVRGRLATAEGTIMGDATVFAVRVSDNAFVGMATTGTDGILELGLYDPAPFKLVFLDAAHRFDVRSVGGDTANEYTPKSDGEVIGTIDVATGLQVGPRSSADAASGINSCAISPPDDAVHCWGINASGEAIPPAGTFVQVAAGMHHTCALRTDRMVRCWGLNDDGQIDAPTNW